MKEKYRIPFTCSAVRQNHSLMDSPLIELRYADQYNVIFEEIPPLLQQLNLVEQKQDKPTLCFWTTTK